MDNHYHLFIKTSLGNISQGMHYLNTSYANYFTAKYKTNGPLFQGRYKSLLVDEDNYALTLSTYIHLNPIRAGIAKNLDEYAWSSLLDYLGKRYSSLSLKEIGKTFDMDYTAVSQATRRFEDKIRKDNKIRIMVNSVLELLKD